MVKQIRLLLAAGALGAAQAFPRYVLDVPNGVQRFGGEPVGHSSGAPRLDSFAAAYNNAGLVWLSVCNLDSDGDGRTNGEELGDPNCIWAKGDEPEFAASSNPGVADVAGEVDSGDVGGVANGDGGFAGFLSDPGVLAIGAVFLVVASVGVFVKRRNAHQEELAVLAAGSNLTVAVDNTMYRKKEKLKSESQATSRVLSAQDDVEDQAGRNTERNSVLVAEPVNDASIRHGKGENDDDADMPPPPPQLDDLSDDEGQGDYQYEDEYENESSKRFSV